MGQSTDSKASNISPGDVANLQKILEGAFRELALPKDAVHYLLEERKGRIRYALVNAIRRQAEAMTGEISIPVSSEVDRTKKPEEVLSATGRKRFHTSESYVVDTMPHGEGEVSEIILFRLGRVRDADAVEGEYQRRGLIPADPYTLAKVNEDNPALADTFKHMTVWKGERGRLNSLCFGRPKGDSERAWGAREEIPPLHLTGLWAAGVRVGIPP